MLQLLPAIDLMGGEVVRLEQGDASRKTVYSSDPAAMAKKWEAAGGDWIHVVDLDAAFSGVSGNLDAFAAIAAAVGIPCELGGGMRDEGAIRNALDAGAARVIIGSRAAGDVAFVREMCEKFGGEKIAIGIDARDGKVATQGWTKDSGVSADDLALAVAEAGVGALIYTDIATDGMLKGPNLSAMEHMVRLVPVPVIASGGVSGPADVVALAGIHGLHGVIMGKALYADRMPADLRSILGTESSATDQA